MKHARSAFHASLLATALYFVFGQAAFAQQDEYYPYYPEQDQPEDVQNISSPPGQVTFKLIPNPKFLNCLRASSYVVPTATVTVHRGHLNDTLFMSLSGIKPGLQFDMFTVQNSPFLANGQPDPKFKNFGLAWYQSDVDIPSTSTHSTVQIQTILLDQIFGFDPVVALPPTNTFHVGIWFNNPKSAAACGFDPSKPTPFNGEHRAGPVAMITLPVRSTNLGPLCTNPNFSKHPVTCNP
jgi:hypothetical protein